MTPASDRAKGTVFMVSAVIILSPDALLISLVSLDPWTLVFWRGFLTSCTLAWALVASSGTAAAAKFHRMGRAGLLSGSFFALSTVSFVLSIRLTSAANTLVIIAAMPLFAAILTRVFLTEKVPARTWAAIAVGFSGIVLVFAGSLSGGSLLGDLLALLTALLMAANFVIIRSRPRISMIPAVILSGLLTSAATLFISAPFTAGPRDLLLLAAMGSVVMPVPLAFMTVAPKLIPAAEVSLIMLLETFLGPFWVWLVVGQRPVKETMLGGGLLVGTLILHALAGRKDSGKG